MTSCRCCLPRPWPWRLSLTFVTIAPTQEELDQLRQLLGHVAAVRRELRPCEEKAAKLRQQPSELSLA
jgi:hypothetical protein